MALPAQSLLRSEVGLRCRIDGRTLATLALVGATALWATSFVAAKAALEGFPPLTLSLLRCVIAYAVLRPFLRRSGQSPAGGRTALLLGLTGIAVPLVSHNLALRWSGAGDATLVHGGALPILAGLLAIIVLKERPSVWTGAGLAASFAGVVLVSGGTGARVGTAAAGMALLLLGTAAFAVFLVIGRRAFALDGWLAALAGGVRASVVVLLPLSAIEIVFTDVPHPSLTAGLALCYLGAGCSALALGLKAVALRSLEAGRVAVMDNFEIPLGLAAGSAMLGEGVGPLQLGGAALICVGAWFAVRSSGSRSLDRPPAI